MEGLVCGVCKCVHMCVSAHMYVQRTEEGIGVLFWCSPLYALWQLLSLGPKLTISARLSGRWALRIWPSLPSNTSICRHLGLCLALTRVLGTQTLVLLLMKQVLFPTEPSPQPGFHLLFNMKCTILIVLSVQRRHAHWTFSSHHCFLSWLQY